MKRPLLFLLLLAATNCFAARPRYIKPGNPDQIWQNDLDLNSDINLMKRSLSPSSTSYCIDSPTLCVDTVANRVFTNGNYVMSASSYQTVSGEPFDWAMKGIEFGQVGTYTSHWLWKFAVLKSSITGNVQISKPSPDDLDQTNIITVDMDASGLNGLATGEGRVANKFKYGYLIGNGSNVGGLWTIHSPTDTAKIAMPPGYTYFKFFATQLLNASSVPVRMVKVDDYVKYDTPQIFFSSSPAGTSAAMAATVWAVNTSSALPLITSWSADIQAYTIPRYGVAGPKQMGIGLGWTNTAISNPCGGVSYQDGSATDWDKICMWYGMPIFNEGGPSDAILYWQSQNATANLTSHSIFLYVWGYRERNQ